MTIRTRKLTEAQVRILREVRAAGEKVYNGRSRPAIEELSRRQLVVYRYTGGPNDTQVLIVNPVGHG